MRNKRLAIIFSILCFVTLLIVLNSVIFSIQNVEVYCYNVADEQLEAKVLSSHNIKLNSNIFALNEQESIDYIEQRVADIYVRNIERIFPNTVSINYVKLTEYFFVRQQSLLYIFANNQKLTKIENADMDVSQLIEVKIKGELKSVEIGEKFSSTHSYDNTLFSELVYAIERIKMDKAINSLEFVDISRTFIYFKTDAGVFFEFQSGNNILGKLTFGIDTYNKCLSSTLADEVKKSKTGTFIFADTNPLTAAYNVENRYDSQ